MTDEKQCTLCGRRGYRWFTRIEGGPGWQCLSTRACRRRRAAFYRPLSRIRKSA